MKRWDIQVKRISLEKSIKALKVKEEESVKIWERMPTALTAEVVNWWSDF